MPSRTMIYHNKNRIKIIHRFPLSPTTPNKKDIIQEPSKKKVMRDITNKKDIIQEPSQKKDREQKDTRSSIKKKNKKRNVQTPSQTEALIEPIPITTTSNSVSSSRPVVKKRIRGKEMDNLVFKHYRGRNVTCARCTHLHIQCDRKIQCTSCIQSQVNCTDFFDDKENENIMDQNI